MFRKLFLRKNIVQLHLSFWCHIVIEIPNVEINESVLIDSILIWWLFGSLMKDLLGNDTICQALEEFLNL